MRVLMVGTAYPPSIGGAQLHAHELVRALARAGGEPHVATIWRSSRTDWLRGTTVRAPSAPAATTTVDGIPVHQLWVSRPRSVSLGVLAGHYPAVLTGLGDRTLRTTAMSLWVDAVEALFDQCRPDVVHMTRIGRVHPYAAALQVARRRGVPTVLTANHHPSWTRRRDRWWWDLYREVDAVIALTDAERHLLEDGGVDPARIHRGSVGIVGAPVVSDRRRQEHPTVVFLGQAQRHKGLDLLAAAWPSVASRSPGASLEVVGPWPGGMRRTRRLLEGMDGVTVHGPVDPQAKWEVLSRAHVLAVPSAGESLGGVYLEAWAAGAVPVGRDIPAVRELLRDAGRVVGHDHTELADVLVDLLADPDAREALVRTGQQRLAAHHEWDTIADAVMAVYECAARPDRCGDRR